LQRFPSDFVKKDKIVFLKKGGFPPFFVFNPSKFTNKLTFCKKKETQCEKTIIFD